MPLTQRGQAIRAPRISRHRRPCIRDVCAAVTSAGGLSYNEIGYTRRRNARRGESRTRAREQHRFPVTSTERNKGGREKRERERERLSPPLSLSLRKGQRRKRPSCAIRALCKSGSVKSASDRQQASKRSIDNAASE